MKTLTLFLLTLITITATHAQTIRIADNNTIRPTGANVYSTLQAAIDAAQPDDIVYITPSITSYGNVTIAKRIVLQGVGHIAVLGDRYSPIGTVTLISSTDGVNSVSGLVLRDFYCVSVSFSSTGIGTPIFDNITIENLVGGGGGFAINGSPNRVINNLRVRNNLLNSFSIYGTVTNSKIYHNVISQLTLYNSTSTVNNVITNNIFSNGIAASINGNLAYYCININTSGAVNNTIISNNVITGTGTTFAELDGVIIINNIFYGSTPNPHPYSNNYFRNNNFSSNIVTSTVTMPPAGTNGGTNNGVGNLVGVSPNFVSVASTTWDATYDYSLNASSPAKNSGTDGTDIGPTGGAYPINKNIVFGPSALPLITELNTSGVVPQNQPLKVNLKAKSN